MFMSREIDIKLCQNYTKILMYEIFYKSSRFKQIMFSKYATNLKTIVSHRSLRISDLFLFHFFHFYFAFLIYIIDNIITYRPYSPYYVTSASANGSAVYWSRDFRLYHVRQMSHMYRLTSYILYPLSFFLYSPFNL